MVDTSIWKVLVDTREPDDSLIKIKKFFPSARMEKLDVGDIFYKSVAIELKSFQDFIQTIMDKRFRNQLYNFLINKNIEGYYIIYGNWEDISKYSQINIRAVVAAMASIEARYGLRLNVFPNKDYAIYYSAKIIEKSFDRREIKPTTFRITNDDRAINMILDGAERLQSKAALSALEYFGSVKSIINSTSKELQKIKNIGEVTAERFFETVNFNFKQKKEFEDAIDEEFGLIDTENDKIENIPEPKEVIDAEEDIIAEEKTTVRKKSLVKESPKEVIDIDNNTMGNEMMVNRTTVFKAIVMYREKKGKPCPLNSLLNGIKLSKAKIKTAINDLILDSKIYSNDVDLYDVY